MSVVEIVLVAANVLLLASNCVLVDTLRIERRISGTWREIAFALAESFTKRLQDNAGEAEEE